MENQKFKLLEESLKAISKGSLNFLAVKGGPGTGKSRTILNFLNENHINFKLFNCYTTPLYFYNLIYRNRNKSILIFDDVDGIQDFKIISILKSLCWNPENKKREISYFSTSDALKNLKIPLTFKTDAKIILIFNNYLKGFDAVINRGVLIDFNFNFKEKLKIFEEIKQNAGITDEVLKYVKNNCNESTLNLNVRSLVILSNLQKEGFDFVIFAKEILKNDEETQILLNLVSESHNLKVSEQADLWTKQTGKSRASFFRYKKRFNL